MVKRSKHAGLRFLDQGLVFGVCWYIRRLRLADKYKRLNGSRWRDGSFEFVQSRVKGFGYGIQGNGFRVYGMA